MDGNTTHLPAGAEHGWWHATICFPGDAGIPPHAAAALSAALSGQRFHFLRKQGKLRLRTERPAADLLDHLLAEKVVTSWAGGVYEPETDAFGGPQAMDIAHQLFCADSRAALTAAGTPHAKEHCVLLISTLNRACGLDPFEIGDVWAKIAALRPAVEPPPGQQRSAAITAMRRLVNADAAQHRPPDPGWPDRVAAFETAGRKLAKLATRGLLTRGLRAVLAHHAIFAFNRAAVPVPQQAAAAWLGRQAAFGDDAPSPETSRPATSTPADVLAGRADARAPNLKRMETTITETTDPAELRKAMVTTLTDAGHLRTPAIIDAFGAVERHRFLPGADPQDAYLDDAVAIKHNDAGEMISCISAPSIVATQLEQLAPQPGHTILEAGAATGYNAALLAHLVTPTGQVWTVDVDQDLVDRAAEHLAAAGASNAAAVLADGAAGLPDHAPYDRIQFTVGAADIPTAVLDQLAPAGRLVIPMRIRGSISRSFAFEREGDTWKAVSCEMATFVPLRKGIGDDTRTMIPMHGDGNVRLETYTEQNTDPQALRTVLDQPSHKVYTGVKFRQGSQWQWVYLWLACVLPGGLSRMPGQRPGFTPHFGWGSMAALDHDSLAYLTVREGHDTDGRYWEIGVIGHGPRGTGLADDVAAAITEWARDYGNDAPAPGFRMATHATRERLTAPDPRFIIDKPHSRLVVDWP
ncbi:methyltransferase, FxLD system [Actinomadura geliboluensis]|uniref:methyltransferase, FxLD system n=1 Tax=Actinomadura geliboluensis TaxID=882440 RepID=UPI002629CDB2|nr:methyltransferase, FxLD system [Actinomadura geliboluensis]